MRPGFVVHSNTSLRNHYPEAESTLVLAENLTKAEPLSTSTMYG